MEYQILQQKDGSSQFRSVWRISAMEKLIFIFLEGGDWFGLSEWI